MEEVHDRLLAVRPRSAVVLTVLAAAHILVDGEAGAVAIETEDTAMEAVESIAGGVAAPSEVDIAECYEAVSAVVGGLEVVDKEAPI